MEIKNEVLKHINSLKLSQNQSTLFAINEVIRDNKALEGAGASIDKIKEIVANNEIALSKIDKFGGEVEALPDPDEELGKEKSLNSSEPVEKI